MPLFQYKAVTPAGEVLEGLMDADSGATAVARLQAQGYIPIRAEEAKSGARAANGPSASASRRRGRINDDSVAIVTREIATLLRAGLPLDRTMEILIGIAENDAVAELLTQVRNEVRGGAALSQALENQKGVFSRFYINMVKAGEAGGALASVLLRLSEFLERAKEMRGTVTAAMVYPAFLAGVTLVSLIVLLVVVVPKFAPIFDQAGKALPEITVFILGLSKFMTDSWPVLMIVGGVIALAINFMLKNPATRLWWDKVSLTLPLFGDLIGKVEMARLSRTLGTLLGNGVPLVGALAIARDTMVNSHMASALGDVGRELKEGQGFGKPLLATRRFPPFAVHMVMVGEETGRLDDMLNQVAEVYDREVQMAVKKLLAFVEPVMIVVMALLIGTVIIAILSALLSMYDLAM
jgi:general secretion pathway protein F